MGTEFPRKNLVKLYEGISYRVWTKATFKLGDIRSHRKDDVFALPTRGKTERSRLTPLTPSQPGLLDETFLCTLAKNELRYYYGTYVIDSDFCLGRGLHEPAVAEAPCQIDSLDNFFSFYFEVP